MRYRYLKLTDLIQYKRKTHIEYIGVFFENLYHGSTLTTAMPSKDMVIDWTESNGVFSLSKLETIYENIAVTEH